MFRLKNFQNGNPRFATICPFLPHACHRAYLATTCCLFLAASGWAKATTLSDNLSAPTDYTELVYGSNWTTASFGTGAANSTLSSATLLLQLDTGDVMNLDLYSDRNGQPGSLVGALTAPISYTSTSYSPTVFGGNGLSLSANTTYWLVANSSNGQFEWAYTDDNTGSGSGFQHTWGFSTDGRQSWYTSDLEPMQMRVDDSSSSAVPQPTALTLLLLGSTMLTLAFFPRRSSRARTR